jgi:acetyl esterase/lipase
MYLLSWLILAVLAAWAFERFYLRGRRIGEFPKPANPGAVRRFGRPGDPGPVHKEVLKQVRELTLHILVGTQKDDLKKARAAFETISDGLQLSSVFTPVDAAGVPGEWVISPGADSNKRVLYIHGGGFVMGSPKSHRNITNRFSEVTGCAVLAIDYRLMPENRLKHCVADCRAAYHWLLQNGPDGPAQCTQMFIGGDSAGGNLTLSLTAWIRDNALPAPNAVVALSPLTDTTFTGASIRDNEDSDFMLKPFLGILNGLPQFVKSWWALWNYKVRPGNPVASPLLGDLSGLPPTLVQVSEAEMLFDDARRYVYKACDSGSPAQLQSWADMVHIWQIFVPQLPQAVEAWAEIAVFLDNHKTQDGKAFKT